MSAENRQDTRRERLSLSEQLRLFPFVRLALALLAGIAWQATPWAFAFPAAWAAVGLTAAFLLLLLLPARKAYTRQWLCGAAALLAVFFTGAAALQRQPTHTALPPGETVGLQAEVCDVPLVTDRYTKLQAVVKQYASATDTVPVSEKIILYVQGLDTATAPVAGSTIYIGAARLSEIPPPGNPDEFDYRQFLARRHIFVSAFVSAEDCLITPPRSVWTRLRYLPLAWQQQALQVFKDSPLGEHELAVMAALSLGTKQYLNDEIRTAYISSGAMHILAVSGLHVGIIMGVLQFLLSFLTRRKYGLVWRNACIIACLWLYAAVVGFSPSVTRATVMFSFVLLGGMLQRRLSVYNSLAASAFFICLFQPQVLFEASFQLSYGAVWSIVYFQPKLYRLLYVKNKLLDSIWQLATVSVAAQIGTLPVSLSNFHLFPNYFLLTNICIITLTGFIVYGGALYLAVHAVPVLSTLVGHLLHAMLWLLNSMVRLIESLPYSVTNYLYLNDWQTGLLTVVILCTAGYLYFPRRRWLWIAVYCIVGIAGGRVWQHVERHSQQMVAIYNIRNATCVQFIHGTEVFTLHDSAHLGQPFAFQTGNFRVKHGIAAAGRPCPTDAVKGDTLIAGGGCYHGFIVFHHQLYKILADETFDKHLPAVPVDYLLVTGAARMWPAQALQRYLPKKIVVDGSVPPYRVRQWLAAAAEKAIDIHSVRDEGACIINNIP